MNQTFEKYVSLKLQSYSDYDYGEISIEVPKEDLRKLNFIQRKALDIILTDDKYIIKINRIDEK